MKIYIQIENYDRYIAVAAVLYSINITAHYAITHSAKYTHLKEEGCDVFICYDDELYDKEPRYIKGGNMYYQTFMTDTYINELYEYSTVYNLPYKVMSSYLFVCDFYLTRLEEQLKQKALCIP